MILKYVPHKSSSQHISNNFSSLNIVLMEAPILGASIYWPITEFAWDSGIWLSRIIIRISHTYIGAANAPQWLTLLGYFCNQNKAYILKRTYYTIGKRRKNVLNLPLIQKHATFAIWIITTTTNTRQLRATQQLWRGKVDGRRGCGHILILLHGLVKELSATSAAACTYQAYKPNPYESKTHIDSTLIKPVSSSSSSWRVLSNSKPLEKPLSNLF